MRHAPPPSKEDLALFETAIGPVRRLQAEQRAERVVPPEPEARQRAFDEAAALRTSQVAPFALGESDGAERIGYRRPEVSPRILQRLGRGLYAVQDEIDLHHLDATAATEVLRAFLADARSRGKRCVRIIHGKGLHSKSSGPVLKGLVERYLSLRRDVLACSSAPAVMGGTGAVLVLLLPAAHASE